MKIKCLTTEDPIIYEVEELFDAEAGTSSHSLRDADAQSEVIACISNDSLVGALEFCRVSEDEARILNMVVKEEYRKQGVATDLLKSAEYNISSKYMPAPTFISTIPTPYSFQLFGKFGYEAGPSSEYYWIKKVF